MKFFVDHTKPRFWIGVLGLFLSCPNFFAFSQLQNNAVKNSQEKVITEQDIIQSIEKYHPQIQSALLKVESQKASLLAADGAFDPVLSAKGKLQTGGYYELRTIETEIRQPTPFWGIEGWARYRIGLGVDESNRFPTYYENETLAKGEIRGGLRIPIWRDGLTDERRTQQTQASFAIESELQNFAQKKLDLEIKGIVTFWKWAAMVSKAGVAQNQLELLQKRQQQLQDQNNLGSISELSLMENERAIAFQQNLLLQYEQAVQQIKINLILFLRGEYGKPLPLETSLNFLSQPLRDIETMEQEEFLKCQPEIKKIEADVSSLEAELAFAKNQLAPKALIEVDASRDFGSPSRNPTLAGTVFEAKASLEIPLLLRKERGKKQKTSALLAAKKQELQWAKENAVNRLQALKNQLEFARKRFEKTKDLLEKSEKLTSAERTLFDSGASDLLRVNIREQFQNKTQIEMIDAKNETHAIEGVILRWKNLKCD